jgi:biofilm PGA synthesis N-glycosyltransferase PgaC
MDERTTRKQVDSQLRGERGYALVTAAKNEESFIEKTIQAVLCQTLQPVRWVIVSDGSTDATDRIVKEYAAKHACIRFLRRDASRVRSFGSKALSFNSALGTLQDVDYSYIGNLDADVTFEAFYFESLVEKMRNSNILGIGGGVIRELKNGRYVVQNVSPDSVAGAVQLFRRECFDAIGGYYPIEGGGIDSAAEIMARMKGWQVKTFFELGVYHHRRVAWTQRGVFRANFRAGELQRRLGYHPLFQAASATMRWLEKPIILGSIATLVGFWAATLRGVARVIPAGGVQYLRQEQLEKLRAPLRRRKCIG